MTPVSRQVLIKCAAEGPVPVELTISPEYHTAIEHFSQHNLWSMHEGLVLETCTISPPDGTGRTIKTYPVAEGERTHSAQIRRLPQRMTCDCSG